MSGSRFSQCFVCGFSRYSAGHAACVLAALLAFAAGWAQPLPTPAPAPAYGIHSLPSPGVFAPAPFALPGSRQAAQKQLCSLLRRLEPVQAVDLLVSGDESAPDCKVLVTCRPGRQLTADTLQSIAYLCISSLPGLSPQRLSILDTQGHLLYSNGQAQAALSTPPSQTHPLLWLLVAVGLALGGAFLALHGRRAAGPRADDLWQGLIRRQETELLSLLAGERPEAIGLLLENLPQPSAERLRRGLRRRQIVPVASPLPVDPQVVEAVKLSVRRRLSGS